MVWGIGSIKHSKRPFRRLRWRLLLSYLGVMVAISCTSIVVAYGFFARSLYHQFDRQLLTLADAGGHGLAEVKARVYGESPEGEAEDDDHEQEDESDHDTEGEHHNAPLEPQAIAPRLDNDGDLDIPWQNFQQPVQGIEWFDQRGVLLAQEGLVFPLAPLGLPVYEGNGGQTLAPGVRSLVWVVYGNNDRQQRIQGYVRVSQSTAAIEGILSRLRWGLVWGVLIAAGLTTVGGWWLTNQAVKPVEASFQQLKQFTADASHELRSPLTAIKTSMDVIRSHPERIHPADHKKIEAIASALAQIIRLVEDLLMLARSDRQTHPQEWRPIPLDELLEDLVELWLPQAESKQISLRSQLAPTLPLPGDGFLLQRLFANLLENAIHYTPSGGQITLGLTQQDGELWVSVTDTGLGIAPEHLPFIFDRLWRADQARSRRAGGSGLGLAIAKSIAEQHQGQILVTSHLGQGSCFQVVFPL